MPDPTTYPWLPPSDVRAWVKVAESSPKAPLVELCRAGAADWIEGQRADLFVTTGEGEEEVTTFEATGRIKMAGLLSVARLVARMDSPNGVVSFDELGSAGAILSRDPDVARLLGRRKRLAVG